MSGEIVYRNRLEMKRDVLIALIEKPLRLNRISQKANINNVRLKQFIKTFVENELVTVVPYRKTWKAYKLTSIGRDVITQFVTLSALLGENNGI